MYICMHIVGPITSTNITIMAQGMFEVYVIQERKDLKTLRPTQQGPLQGPKRPHKREDPENSPSPSALVPFPYSSFQLPPAGCRCRGFSKSAPFITSIHPNVPLLRTSSLWSLLDCIWGSSRLCWGCCYEDHINAKTLHSDSKAQNTCNSRNHAFRILLLRDLLGP